MKTVIKGGTIVTATDYYQGDVGSLAVLMMSFPLGSVTASLLLLKRGRLRRKGLALGVSQDTDDTELMAAPVATPPQPPLTLYQFPTKYRD